MKKRHIALLLAVVFLLGLVVLNQKWEDANRRSAIKCTLEWGRLAPFPESSREFEIETTGGMFSREFRVSFVTDKATLASWLDASPGIADAKMKPIAPGLDTYVIEPGGGAQYAEVTVDRAANRVRIRVYWS